MRGLRKGIDIEWCGRLHPIQWELDGEADRDSVLCITILWMPVLPLGPAHTYGWHLTGGWDTEWDCEHFDRRWSWSLFLSAFGRRWLTGLLVLSVICPILFVMVGASHDLSLIRPDLWIGASAVAGPAALAGLWALSRLGRRGTDIRLVIGPQDIGSCDPAVWNRELLEAHSDPMEAYGAPSFTAASAAALDQGQFARAMCAARLAVAVGEQDGRKATKRVLSHPRVAAALPALRDQPFRRWALLPEAPPGAEQQVELDRRAREAAPAPPAPAATGEPEPLALEAAPAEPTCAGCGERVGDDVEPFYDGRLHCTPCIERAAGEEGAEEYAGLPPLEAAAPRSFVLMILTILVGLGIAASPAVMFFEVGARSASIGVSAVGLFVMALGVDGLRHRVGLRGGVLTIGRRQIPLDHLTEVRATDRRLTVSWKDHGYARMRIRGPKARTIAAALEIIARARN